MSITTVIAASAATLALAGTGAATAGAASAATVPQPPRMAYGSVELGNPLQYEQFQALQGYGHNHGEVDYTNWASAEPGSGVWAPSSNSTPLVFTTVGGTAYDHTLNGGLKLVAQSPDRLSFTGTGQYDASTTWTIKAHVKDAKFRAVIAYSTGYTVTMTGQVASNGSVSGTAIDSLGHALTWTMPAGAFVSVLHYVAPIQSDQIGRHDATFSFTIPASVAGLGGTKVTVKVHDGGPGAAHDSYAHGVTGTVLQPYPIIGGPGITVIGR